MMPIAGRLRAGLSFPNQLKLPSFPRFKTQFGNNVHSKQNPTVSSQRQQQQYCSATIAMQTAKLWEDIVETYDKAQAAQASTITDTSTDIYLDNDVPFILKIASILRDKPKETPTIKNDDSYTSSDSPKRKKEWRNPFLPPDKDLVVCHLSSTHSLVLNKYNIVPHHALIITREFVPQEEPLTAADFSATWQVMHAMPRGGLSYFNRGPVSGASQPHKHIQIVPLPLNSSLVNSDNDDVLVQDPPFWPAIAEATAGKPTGIDGVTSVSSFPFVNFVARIDSTASVNDTGEMLAKTHAILVDLAFKAATKKSDSSQLPAAADIISNFSYNTIATKQFIMVVPRSKEGSGPLSCNAMAFAGSFFVRGTDELAFIKEKGPFKILQDVGIAP